jgi:two-component system cell cycle sensor histidine kinase/response regulator CckA
MFVSSDYEIEFLHHLIAIILLSAIFYDTIGLSLNFFTNFLAIFALSFVDPYERFDNYVALLDILLFLSGVYLLVFIFNKYKNLVFDQGQKQIIIAQKMEAIGKLSGNIAHDFNNNLMVILGSTEILLNTMDSSDDNYALISTINDASENARFLVKQLLAISGQKTQEKSLIHLNPFFDKLESMLKRVTPPDIQINVELKDDDLYTWGDSYSLEQVILNLFINSRDAIMHDEGVIEILVKKYHEDQILLQITDNGSGIPNEYLTRIYDPFFTSKKEGTGLGLTITKTIINKMDGSIRIENANPGTVVKVFLPLKYKSNDGGADNLAARSSEHLKTSISILKEPLNMLVVDDDTKVRSTIVTLLNSIGITTHTFCNGSDALSWYSKNMDTDYLLIDIIMPEMNGKELYQEVRKINPSQKIIFISGFSDSDLEEEIKSKYVTFLQKPFSLPTFIATLEKFEINED